MIESKLYNCKYDVCGKIHEKDFIFEFLRKHSYFPTVDLAMENYFSGGRNSALKFRKILVDDLGVDINEGRTFLEFASGYGCVTRHLLKVLPELRLTASDIHPEANSFLEMNLGCETVQSFPVPEDYPDRKYDLVFALSFFSHMPRTTWSRWLRVLVANLTINGFLIFTTHGLGSRPLMNSPELDEDGFWFQKHSEQDDLQTTEYGTTITSPSFVLNEIGKIEGCRLFMLKTEFWWGHQDLYVVKKTI